jgi:hypothetical protein
MLQVGPGEAFEEAFRRYGGVPRAVLQSSLHAYESQIRSSLAQMVWAECSRSVGSASANVGVRHKLLYFFVSDDLKSARLAFGTDYLLRAAADDYIYTMIDAITQVMRSPWPGLAPGIAGAFMEDVYHSWLCLSAHVNVRMLKTSSRASPRLFQADGLVDLNVEQLPLDWTRFTSQEDAITLVKAACEKGKTLYLRPYSYVFPAVDAIMVLGSQRKVLLIQCTISAKHTTSAGAGSTLKFLIEGSLAAKAVAALVYAVPPKEFDSYKHQDAKCEQWVMLPEPSTTLPARVCSSAGVGDNLDFAALEIGEQSVERPRAAGAAAF